VTYWSRHLTILLKEYSAQRITVSMHSVKLYHAEKKKGTPYYTVITIYVLKVFAYL